MGDPFKIYFAGDLFNHKDLLGNLLLADAIAEQSSGRFICALPQNLEHSSGRSVDIRNQDLLQIILSDLVLLNFDGSELDSGTVVEFIFAKALDIPAVILRTDFRNSGDQDRDGDPWNLMCSGYPRTEVITLNGMARYQEAIRSESTGREALESFYSRLAAEVIQGFESVLIKPSVLVSDKVQILERYRWALSFPGSGLKELMSEEEMKRILMEKRKKGLI